MEFPMPTPVFVYRTCAAHVTARTHRGERPDKKGRSPSCNWTISKVEQMFTTDNTTTSKTVKIYCTLPPERCPTQGAGGRPIARYRHHLPDDSKETTCTPHRYTVARRCSRVYQRSLLGKRGGGMKANPTHRTARMRDHALPLEHLNQSKQGE